MYKHIAEHICYDLIIKLMLSTDANTDPDYVHYKTSSYKKSENLKQEWLLVLQYYILKQDPKHMNHYKEKKNEHYLLGQNITCKFSE